MPFNEFIRTLVGADLSASVDVPLAGLVCSCALSAPTLVCLQLIPYTPSISTCSKLCLLQRIKTTSHRLCREEVFNSYTLTRLVNKDFEVRRDTVEVTMIGVLIKLIGQH